MSNIRPVCLYSQYYCCPSHKDCRLYHLCSQLPKKPFVSNSRVYRVIRAVPLSKAEISYHKERYKYYNYFFGDLKKKISDYCKKNHEYKMEYQRQYREKNKQNKSEFNSILFDGLCNKNCEDCKYSDCILPTWSNRQEYDALYYLKNKELKKQRSQQYYETHKEHCRQRSREYYLKHRNEILSHNKEKWCKNKDKYNAARRDKRKQKKKK